MANFCTKCGRKLINGQPCICTQQNAEDTQEYICMYLFRKSFQQR